MSYKLYGSLRGRMFNYTKVHPMGQKGLYWKIYRAHGVNAKFYRKLTSAIVKYHLDRGEYQKACEAMSKSKVEYHSYRLMNSVQHAHH